MDIIFKYFDVDTESCILVENSLNLISVFL